MGEQTDPPIVTYSTFGPTHTIRRFSRLHWLVIGSLCLLLLGGGTVYAVKARVLMLPWTTAAKASPTVSTPAQAIKAAQAELQRARTPQAKSMAFEHLGVAYFDNNQADQAIPVYQNALSEDKSDQATVLFDLADAYHRSGNISGEITILQQLEVVLSRSHDASQLQLAPKVQRFIR